MVATVKDTVLAQFDDIVQWYGVDLLPLHVIAPLLGTNSGHLSRVLAELPQEFARARELRAATLHAKAVAALTEPPLRYIDAEGNERVDSGDVTWRRLQAQEMGRLAGIMDRQYREQPAQLDVAVTVAGGGVSALLAAVQQPAIEHGITVNGEASVIDDTRDV